MVYRKGKRIDGRDLSEQGNCELFCLGTKLMKRANAPNDICGCEGLVVKMSDSEDSTKELSGPRKGAERSKKEGGESRDWGSIC